MWGRNRDKEKNDSFMRDLASKYGIVYSSSEDFWYQLSEMMDSFKKTISSLKSETNQTMQELEDMKLVMQEKVDDLRKCQDVNMSLQNMLKEKEGTLTIFQEREKRLAWEMMSMMEQIDNGKVREDVDKETILELLSRQADDALEVLGITSVNESSGVVDSRFQKVSGSVPTDDPELDGKIYASLSRGFRKGQELVKEQEVVIYTIR